MFFKVILRRAGQLGPADVNPKSATPLHVLVVEDDPPTLRALQMYLESYGHTVTSAREMTTAVKLARTVDFDVLLTDLNLPDGTGWEVVEKAAAVKPVRAIAFSGFGQDSDLAQPRHRHFGTPR